MTELAVDLSDLRGYAELVRRAADDCATMEARSLADLPDGDFGRILELVTYDYEAVLPPFRAILGEDSRRLRRVATTLDAVAGDFAKTDHDVAESFGLRLPLPEQRNSAGFGDAEPMETCCLAAPSLELPVIHLGFPLDQVCEVVVRMGHSDPRDALLHFLVGDMTKAMTQVAYWEQYAANIEHVRANLAEGARIIRRTWEGRASDRAEVAVERWLGALSDQSQRMRELGEHLRGMVHEAINLAGLIVDSVRFFITTVGAGLACAYLPIYGEVKIIDKIRDTWHLLVNAYRVLGVFWGFLRAMSDVLRIAVDAFSVTHLPSAPSFPTRGAA